MLGRILCSAILGIDAYMVAVGAHLCGGILPKFVVAGVPGGAQKKQRACRRLHSIPQFEKAIVVGKNKHSFLKNNTIDHNQK